MNEIAFSSSPLLTFIIGIAINTIIAFFLKIIYTVQQQTIAIVERFGKYAGYTTSGLNFKLPDPISNIAGIVNLRITQSEHMLSIKTKDNAFISLPVKVQLKVIPERVVDSFYKLQNPEQQINSFILNIVRSKSATLDLEEIYTKKSELAEHVSKILENKMAKYGYQIVDILVDEPEPSAEVQNAYNNVIASKRELDAAHNKAAAKKTLLIGEAEAEARSLELKAQSYAKQKKYITSGLSDALKEVKQGNITHEYILDFIASIDYRDTIRDAAKSSSNTLVFSNDQTKDMQKLLPLIADKTKK